MAGRRRDRQQVQRREALERAMDRLEAGAAGELSLWTPEEREDAFFSLLWRGRKVKKRSGNTVKTKRQTIGGNKKYARGNR